MLDKTITGSPHFGYICVVEPEKGKIENQFKPIFYAIVDAIWYY